MRARSRRKAGGIARRSAAARHEEALFARVVDIVEAARRHVARSVNTAMVQAYWLIGRAIVEVEQRGEQRAGYGDEVIERLAKRLARRLGQGFGARTLRRIRQFYVTYVDGSALSRELGGPPAGAALPGARIRTAALSRSNGSRIRTAVLSKSSQRASALFPPQLGWTHYLVLLRVANPTARAFYEIEAARESWSSRELERQIASLLFERLAKSRDKEKVLALGDHFYVDLVLYNRLLRAFVLVDLKLGKLSHQDLGQMQMYVNYFDRFHRAGHEARTIGIVLCSEKNDAMARITLPDNERIVAVRHQMYMPSEAELRAQVAREREAAEQALRLAAPEPRPPGRAGARSRRPRRAAGMS